MFFLFVSIDSVIKNQIFGKWEDQNENRIKKVLLIINN